MSIHRDAEKGPFGVLADPLLLAAPDRSDDGLRYTASVVNSMGTKPFGRQLPNVPARAIR
jgi:hypothetical protein